MSIRFSKWIFLFLAFFNTTAFMIQHNLLTIYIFFVHIILHTLRMSSYIFYRYSLIYLRHHKAEQTHHTAAHTAKLFALLCCFVWAAILALSSARRALLSEVHVLSSLAIVSFLLAAAFTLSAGWRAIPIQLVLYTHALHWHRVIASHVKLFFLYNR